MAITLTEVEIVQCRTKYGKFKKAFRMEVLNNYMDLSPYGNQTYQT